MKWRKGRQSNSDYEVLTLLESKKLKLDIHIIKIKPNTEIPLHVDSVLNGRHWRFNWTFGGVISIVRNLVSDEFQGLHYPYIFRPYIQEHCAKNYTIHNGYIFSIGHICVGNETRIEKLIKKLTCK